MKKFRNIVCSFCIVLVISLLFNSVYSDDTKVDTKNNKTGEPNRKLLYEKNLEEENSNFKINTKKFHFDNAVFVMKNIEHKNADNDYFSAFFLPGKNFEYVYMDKDKNVLTEKIVENGVLPTSSVIYIQSESHSALLGQAQQFLELGDDVVEKNKYTYPISVEKTNKGLKIGYRYLRNTKQRSLQWYFYSGEQTFDLNSHIAKKIFRAYDLVQNAVFYNKGYYYRLPDWPLYRDHFYLSPSPYLARSFVLTGGSKLSYYMGQVLLEFAEKNINADGYFPVANESSWLKKDYGLPKGYFDDRWNADLAKVFFEAYKKYDNEKYKKTYIKIASYLLKHVREANLKINTGAYLAQDYSHPNFPNVITHSALNHQIAVIEFLLDIYKNDNNQSAKIWADRLILGVEMIGDRWILPNGDLHYGFFPNQRLGMRDYPDLTYNDLIRLKKSMDEISMKSPLIEKLIASKGKWIEDGMRPMTNEEKRIAKEREEKLFE